MKTEKTEQRRAFKSYVVKPHLQLKFAAITFCAMVAVSLLVWLQGTMFIGKAFVLAMAFAFALSLFFSHFVAGPIYRFERVLEQMRDGRLDLYIQLRKNDELKEVADLFNQAISSLRNRVREERGNAAAAVGKALPLVERLQSSGLSAEATELAHLIEEFRAAPQKIQF